MKSLIIVLILSFSLYNVQSQDVFDEGNTDWQSLVNMIQNYCDQNGPPIADVNLTNSDMLAVSKVLSLRDDLNRFLGDANVASSSDFNTQDLKRWVTNYILYHNDVVQLRRTTILPDLNIQFGRQDFGSQEDITLFQTLQGSNIDALLDFNNTWQNSFDSMSVQDILQATEDRLIMFEVMGFYDVLFSDPDGAWRRFDESSQSDSDEDSNVITVSVVPHSILNKINDAIVLKALQIKKDRGIPVSEEEKAFALNRIISWVQQKIDFEVSRRATAGILAPTVTAVPNVLVPVRSASEQGLVGSIETPIGLPVLPNEEGKFLANLLIDTLTPRAPSSQAQIDVIQEIAITQTPVEQTIPVERTSFEDADLLLVPQEGDVTGESQTVTVIRREDVITP